MTLFSKATKTQARLRLALLGPAGSGKTYSALKIARALVGADGRVALMDTEHGSASKYADLFSFDQVAPDRFDVETYLSVITAAGAGGYDLLILDSLSHAWAGKGGILEFVDARAKATQSGNSFGAWRDATPKHNELIEAMLACPCHLIVTMRTKMEYVQDRDEKGRTTIRKVGLQPVQRDGLEYEFDVVGDLTSDNDLIITKTRCPALRGKTFAEPGEEVAAIVRPWLGEGAPAAVPAVAVVATNGHAAPVNGTAPALVIAGDPAERRAQWAKLVDKAEILGIAVPEAPKTVGEFRERAPKLHAEISAKEALMGGPEQDAPLFDEPTEAVEQPA